MKQGIFIETDENWIRLPIEVAEEFSKMLERGNRILNIDSEGKNYYFQTLDFPTRIIFQIDNGNQLSPKSIPGDFGQRIEYAKNHNYESFKKSKS